MQAIDRREIKKLFIFLFMVVFLTACVWVAIEFSTKRPVLPGKAIKAKASTNLAAKQSEELEDIPIVDENFEVYQFKDPFLPLSIEGAPPENVAPTIKSSSPSAGSASNTAIKARGINLLSVQVEGNRASAAIKLNGKATKVFEGQKIGDYEVIDIDITAKTVEFLDGDQRFVVSSNK